MLPIEPNQEQLQSIQNQLQVRIDELNQLKSWGSGDEALVSDSEIQSIVQKSFESLKSCPNSSLCSSLFRLTERIQLAEDIGFKLKDLAWNVENSLSALNVRNYKDLNLDILEKLGIKDLSNMSKVSKFGNEMGKEVILARIQKMGYEGDNYDEAVKYLAKLKSGLYTLSKLQLLRIASPVLDEILKKIGKFGSKDEEMILDVLEKLKNLPIRELINICTNEKFYDSDFENLRKFIVHNFDINTPLGIDKIPEQLQGNALFLAAVRYDVGILKFLLKLGIAPDTKYNNTTALESVNNFNDFMQRLERPENAKHQEVVDLLTNNPKKKQSDII